jgi:sugar fermentation stimulation protein A
MPIYPFSFPKINGRLVRRVNRFVIEAEVDGRVVPAYLANPGRLWELLLPGTKLLLSNTLSQGSLPYTVLACLREGQHVLLHTHLTNKVIHRLLDECRLPSLINYKVVREEATCGRHRFDLLLEDRATGEPYYLEIKSCTLFAGGVAMFPDAVTARGTRHLFKLQEMAADGIKTGCLFVVMNPNTDYFLPAYHIDYQFSEALVAVSKSVEIMAVAIGFDQAYQSVKTVKEVMIPYDLLQAELQDRGAYLLLIRLDEDRLLGIGSLGRIRFRQGYYLYVGSAMRTLNKRINRHLRKKKKARWHIDYLTAEADKVTAVPIISSEDLECRLAKRLQPIAEDQIKRFGSSDCNCPSHLFYFENNPLENALFIELLQYFRMRRLEEKLAGQSGCCPV